MADWYESGGSGGPFVGTYEPPKRSSSGGGKMAKKGKGGKSKGKGKGGQGPTQIDVLNRQYELEANYRVNEVPNALAALYGQYGGEQTEERRQFNENLGQRRNEFGEEMGQRRSEFDRTFGLDERRYGLEEELGRGRLGLDTRRFGLEEELGRGELELGRGRLGLERERYGLEAELGRGELELGRGRLGLETELGRGRLGLETREQTRREREMEQQYGLEVGALTGYFNGNLTEAARSRRMEEAQSLAGVMGEYRDPITGQVLGQTEARRAALEREAQSRGELSGFIESGARAGQMTEAARARREEETFKNTGQMGVNAQGQMTDAAQQWRTQSALDYARTAAQLSARPQDYFESAAFMRGAQGSGVPAFLQQINQGGFGSNMGFRSAQNGLPQTGSMQALAQGGMGGNQIMTGGGMAGTGNAVSGGEVMAGVVGGGQPAWANTMAGTGGVDQSMVDPVSGARMSTGEVMRDEAMPQSIQMAQAAAGGQQTAYTSSMNRAMPMNAAQQMGQQGGMQGQANQGGQFGGTPGFYGQMSGQDVAQQRLAAFAPTFQAGAHKMAPGAMEAMTPTERGLFQSAAGASGINAEDWQDQYNKSRIHTGGNPNAA